MNRHEQNPLLNELLTGGELTDFRQASLERALSALRLRRHRRDVVRLSAAVSLVCLAFALLLVRSLDHSVRTLASSNAIPETASSPTVAGSGVKFIDDEQLFALFPDRSLALIGKPGRQQLVFLGRVANK
jgi:hypothetical protein